MIKVYLGSNAGANRTVNYTFSCNSENLQLSATSSPTGGETTKIQIDNPQNNSVKVSASEGATTTTTDIIGYVIPIIKGSPCPCEGEGNDKRCLEVYQLPPTS